MANDAGTCSAGAHATPVAHARNKGSLHAMHSLEQLELGIAANYLPAAKAVLGNAIAQLLLLLRRPERQTRQQDVTLTSGLRGSAKCQRAALAVHVYWQAPPDELLRAAVGARTRHSRPWCDLLQTWLPVVRCDGCRATAPSLFLCERRRCLLRPVKGVLTRHKRKVVAPGGNGEQAALLKAVRRAAMQLCPGA